MFSRVLYLFGAFALWPGLAFADAYLDDLTARSHELKLSTEAQWRALLHYRNNPVVTGVTGQADDAAFYLAVDGKTNPYAELDATLASFFDPARTEGDAWQHPQCRFIGRYHWLKEVLHFDHSRLVEQPCSRYRTWRAALNPESITLVFPSAYINNPSSMFGHTLLRIDQEGRDGQSRLLAYAINYEANPGGEDGATFIFKSLVGKYPGLFSILPYYAKVKDYSQLENRDIWEYQLNFTRDEVDRLLMHVWELRQIRFDYYFFDENCAYHLLSLLEVARPTLGLTERFTGWVIPLDTVRVLTEQSGMVSNTVFRPAENTKLRYQLARLSDDEKAWVLDLSNPVTSARSRDLTDVPDEKKSAVFEAAYGLLRYRIASGKADQVSSSNKSRALLVARSHVPTMGTDNTPPEPDITPQQAHRTKRLGVAFAREGSVNSQKIEFRPAYHDLLDPLGGYAPGAQISFLDTVLRFEPALRSVALEQMTVIDIFSLSPRDEFFRPVSWRLSTGYTHVGVRDHGRRALYRNQAGAGLSWLIAPSAQWYAFIDGTADVGRELARDYAIGIGGTLGIYAQPNQLWQIHGFATSQYFEFGDQHREDTLSLEQSFSLGQQQSIRVKIRREHVWGSAATQLEIGWYSYW